MSNKIAKTTYVRALRNNQVNEIQESVYYALRGAFQGDELEEEIELALSGRISDLEDTIDLDSLSTIRLK